MKLFYIANIRFPTERAHGIQVAHMCSAFARNGAEVTLVVSDRQTIPDDPYEYYGVEKNFRVEKIPVPDTVGHGTLGFLVESLIFAYRAAKRVRAEKEVVIYTREELPLLFLKKRIAFYEAHQLRRSFFFRWLIRRAEGIVAITQGLKEALVQVGFSERNILVAHDGYDEKQFSISVTKEEARRHLALPTDTKIALYLGGLEEWKGARTLCEAAEYLESSNILVVIIGGTEKEKKSLEERNYRNVRFLGSRPYRELALNQQAADVLVIPNSHFSPLGSAYASPLKLFAHMASGVPLVVAQVPALTEVVSSAEAHLFTPDEPRSLAETITKALKPEAARVAHAAMEKVKSFTWDKRATLVLNFIADV